MDKAQWDFFLKENGVHKSDNKTRFALAGLIHSQVCKLIKMEIKAIETKSKQQHDESELQKYLDNPLSPEEEAKRLRAMLHMGLDKGDIQPQLLEKLDKIIGVHTEKDDEICVVDWSTAFPDLATALEICQKAQ